MTGYYRLLAGCDQAKTYLLDDYPAAMAYSLRKLRAAQTLSIKVRRTSDNTEQDFGFDGDMIDQAAVLQFCAGASGAVSVFYDQSGNNRDFVQTNAAAQPLIVENGLLKLIEPTATKPTIRLNNDTWLQLRDVNTFSYPTGSIYAAAFGVVNADDSGVDTFGVLVSFASSTAIRGRLELRLSNTTNRTFQANASNTGNLGGTVVPRVQMSVPGNDFLNGKTQFGLSFFMSTSVQSLIYKNAAQAFAGTGTNAPNTFNADTIKRAAIGGTAFDPANIGINNSFVGNVSELIFFNDNKTAELAAISTEQLTAWA